ncbi:MAG TPA: hypothetical protein VN688_19025 [Gemmataceae bacterium]|nr:hypothetical protein [Gemmataceae bacterium]
MPPLTDPEILASIIQVLRNWNVTDYVTWKAVARDWVGQHLEELSLREIARLLHEHVQNGGVIDQVRERRPEWSDRDFHYDFRVPIAGRAIYIETILVDDDPTDPTIHVVSIHDA